MERYVVKSLETHLFFGRIMKEHSVFLLAAFPASETQYRRRADWFRMQFEQALEQAVQLANGNVRQQVLNAGEVVTEFTEKAERQTSCLTGIPIQVRITLAEQRLRSGRMQEEGCRWERQVRNLNRRILRLLDGLITWKEEILQDVLDCRLYTANYPLLIEHILREARWYRRSLENLEKGCFSEPDARTEEVFWNQIMMEHAEFIRGFLDPTECELINKADDFVGEYSRLLEMSCPKDAGGRKELSRMTREITEQYQAFKTAGAAGITGCQVRSVILPLLADHVLREANHYLRILVAEKEKIG